MGWDGVQELTMLTSYIGGRWVRRDIRGGGGGWKITAVSHPRRNGIIRSKQRLRLRLTLRNTKQRKQP